MNKDKIKADGIIVLKKVNISGQHKYELLNNRGKKDIFSKDELIAKKYAKVLIDSFCDPWSEHNIEFDIDRIKSRGFVSSEQATLVGVKGYNFYRADSTSTFFKPDMLVAMKYAKKKVTVVTPEEGFASPWPEHKIEFIPDAIRARGYVRTEQQTMGGINGYKFIKADGTSQFIRVEMVLIQKMAKKL